MLAAGNGLTEAQRIKARYPNAELVSDKKILEVYGGWVSAKKGSLSGQHLKASPVHLTALTILCEDLLGLPATYAAQASEAKSGDDLCARLRPNPSNEKTAI